MDRLTIVRIAGDGVGPELVAAASRIVETLCGPVEWVDRPAGLCSVDAYGTTAPEITLDALRRHKTAIKGPFATPNGGTVRSGNFYIRTKLDLYACLRPIPVDPFRPVLLVRENVEDLYAAQEWLRDKETAVAAKIATLHGCRRIAEYAFSLAQSEPRKRVTVVHKANNLKLTEGMFLDVARSVAREYPDVGMDDMIADTACAALVTDPGSFDVMLTSNTFGDLLSSLGAAVAGGVGLVGSLNSGHGVRVAEAAHGDAAELAGRDRVNPIGMFDSVRLLLAAIGRPREAGALGSALSEAIVRGPRTIDRGGTAGTSEVTEFVCRRSRESLGTGGR